MTTVDETRMKVQRILAANGTVELRGDDMYIKMGSTVGRVSVVDWGDDDTLVKIGAPVLIDVPLTDELYKYVALHSNTRHFGALGLVEGDDGKGLVHLTQTLYGDTVDEPELMFAVLLVTRTADELDDELRERFGGSRMMDYEG